ncbi:MAG: cyclase family protein [Clostridiales bacterium]
MIYDISMLISEDMQVYKNKENKKPKIDLVLKFDKDNCNESSINMNLHTGTHIDAPFHMINNGDTLESIPIDNLVRDCKVLDLTFVDDRITKSDLEGNDISKDDFILLKTRNSFEENFNYDFVYLEKSGAEYLSQKGISGIGIDALGIERNQKNHETHKILFNNKIIIIEGLRLKKIEKGKYFMYALPLKIENVDGSPARVVLKEFDK